MKIKQQSVKKSPKCMAISNPESTGSSHKGNP